MAAEDDLLARLRKIEALMAGAGTAGEREAAGAALERVKARLKLPRFRGRLVGRDQSFSAMALASYSMGER